MTLETPVQIQFRLDGMTEKAKRKHPEEFDWVRRNVVLALEHGPIYPDEIPSLSPLFFRHRNVIGPAIRSLLKSGKVRKTGNYRQSLRKESAGRVVWELALNA